MLKFAVFVLLCLMNSAYAESSVCTSAYQYVSSSEIDMHGDAGDKNQKVDIKGVLYLKKMVKKETDKYQRVLGLLKINEIKSDKEIQDLMKHIYSFPFVVTLSEMNSVKGVKTPPENRKNVLSIAGLVQDIFIPTVEGNLFELSSQGIVKSEYLKKDGKLNKRHLGFYDVKSKQNPDIEIVSSLYTLAADKNDCFSIGVDGSERYTLESKSIKTKADTYAHISVKYDEKLSEDAASVFLSVNEDMNQWEPKVASKRTFSDEELNGLAKSLSDQLVQAKTREEKLSLVNNNLDVMDHLAELLKTGVFADDALLEIHWALGLIDTPRTVDILTTVVQDKAIDESNRFRALRGLVMTETTLTDSQLSGLTSYLEQGNRQSDTDNSVAMALGELAKQRQLVDPEQTASIEHSIIQSIQNSISLGKPDQISINAAYNMQDSADEELANAIIPLINNKRPQIREVSADALSQFDPNPYFVPQIEKQLHDETRNAPKITLLAAYAKHGADAPEFVSTMRNYATDRKQVDDVRLSAVEGLLASGYGADDVQKDDLKKMLVGEKSSKIIKLVAKRIYQLGPEGE